MIDAFLAQKKELILHPQFWDVLSDSDRCEFMRLHNQFRQNLHSSVKDRRVVSFANELRLVLQFIEKSADHKEERSILVGVCFAGPFICVNTRQLKTFLCRCKSSINGSFQQMGYAALRTKAKARQCILALLPILSNEQTILRQWTVRRASDQTDFCFLSSFPLSALPEITDEDLVDEGPHHKSPQIKHEIDRSHVIKRTQSQMIVGREIENPIKPVEAKPKPFITNISSHAVNVFADPDWDLITTIEPVFHPSFSKLIGTTPISDLEIHSGRHHMTRSVSASLDFHGDWSGQINDDQYDNAIFDL